MNNNSPMNEEKDLIVLVNDNRNRQSGNQQTYIKARYDDKTTVYDIVENVMDLNYPFFGNHITPSFIIGYVITSNRIRWNVSCKNCLLVDYLNTYDDILELTYLTGGMGGDIASLFEYLKTLIEWLQAIDWLKQKIQNDRVKKFMNSFLGEDGNYAETGSIHDFIKSRKKWSVNELKKILNSDDETLIRSILYCEGFVYLENDYFIFDKNQYQENKRLFENFEMNKIRKQVFDITDSE